MHGIQNIGSQCTAHTPRHITRGAQSTARGTWHAVHSTQDVAPTTWHSARSTNEDEGSSYNIDDAAAEQAREDALMDGEEEEEAVPIAGED